jgi:fucose 4-O-acetylase-like acetyltransferase
MYVGLHPLNSLLLFDSYYSLHSFLTFVLAMCIFYEVGHTETWLKITDGSSTDQHNTKLCAECLTNVPSLCCETNYIQLRMSFGSERFRTKSLGTAVLQVLSLHLTVLHLIALEH